MTDNFLVPQTKSESMLPKKLPCPFSAAGMQQPSHLQPPPMFGPRGKHSIFTSLVSDSLKFFHFQGQPYLRSICQDMLTLKSIVHSLARLLTIKTSIVNIVRKNQRHDTTITSAMTIEHKHLNDTKDLVSFGANLVTEISDQKTCYMSIKVNIKNVASMDVNLKDMK